MKTIVDGAQPEAVVITIGRAQDNDIALTQANQVSSHHARFHFENNLTLFIEDLASTNGTYINTRRIVPHTLNPVQVTDALKLGSYPFNFDEIKQLNNNALNALFQAPPVNVPKGTEIITDRGPVIISEPIRIDKTKEILTIGRSAENDIILDYPQVSSNHATLKKLEFGYLLTDLHSTNGTFVNGNQIESCHVMEGDSIQLGSIRLEIGHEVIQQYDQSKNVRLDVVGIMSRSKEKIFLNKTSLSILPGELVGVLAPAGAGKSTLMECIIGKRKPTRGKVYINNLDLHDNFDSFRQWIGYVPQDDILHKELTCWQCLYFSAKLRLALSEDEIKKRVENVLADLGLSHVKNTQVGGRKERVSGGQRKRVSLGIELMGDPGLLLFDEATTGLDPKTDQEMMELFKRLTDQGKTMIVITHNVGALNYLDHVLAMASGGYLCYYGPEKECYPYFNEDGPGGIYKHLDKTIAEQNHAKFLASPYHSQYVEERLSSVNPHRTQEPQKMEKKGKKFLDMRQTKILTQRNFTIKNKDVVNTLMLLAQAPIIAFLLTIGFERIDPRGSLLLIISLSAIFFGCINSCRELVGERNIFRRERIVNLNLPGYLLSKYIVFAVFCLVQSLMFLSIIFWKIDMGDKSALFMFNIFFLTSLAGVSLGLFISAIASTQEKAMYAVPIALLPQIIFAGGLFKLEKASEIISYLTISRWSFDAIMEKDVYTNTAIVILIAVILLISTYAVLAADDTHDPFSMKFKRSYQNLLSKTHR
nr:FHA domain-containing protein [uncultured Desulfobacter sp.]